MGERVNEVLDELEFGQMERKKIEIQNLTKKNEKLQLKYSQQVNELINAIEKEEKERNNVEAQMKLVKADMARKLTAKTNDYIQLKAKSLEEMEQMRKEKLEEISIRDLQIEEYERERTRLRSLAKQSLSLTKTRIVNLYRRARRKKMK